MSKVGGFGASASDQARGKGEQAKQFDPSIGKETQFKPGQSGNPGGRPKKKPFTSAIAARIAERPEEIDQAVSHLINLARGQVGFCEGGAAVSAFKVLKETIEGKAVQPLSGPDGGPIQFVDMTDADLDARIQQLIGETGTPGTTSGEEAPAGPEATQR